MVDQKGDSIPKHQYEKYTVGKVDDEEISRLIKGAQQDPKKEIVCYLPGNAEPIELPPSNPYRLKQEENYQGLSALRNVMSLAKKIVIQKPIEPKSPIKPV